MWERRNRTRVCSCTQHGSSDVAPAEVIVFEDSLNGLRAARAAEMKCVIVPCDLTRHLVFEGAWKQYRSLEEVAIADLLR